MRRITLVGFMGCGKSSVGRELSELLRLPLLELDSLIVERTGMEIPLIFERLGEEGFREIEREVLKEVLKREGEFILSTGGGAPAYKDNMSLINSFSLSFFLETPFEELWSRISQDPNRPLVKPGKERVRELYRKRLPFYRRADFTVNCRGKGVKEVALEIAGLTSF
jgi:shikimate kinase